LMEGQVLLFGVRELIFPEYIWFHHWKLYICV
jgi:hypothetical protein